MKIVSTAQQWRLTRELIHSCISDHKCAGAWRVIPQLKAANHKYSLLKCDCDLKHCARLGRGPSTVGYFASLTHSINFNREFLRRAVQEWNSKA